MLNETVIDKTTEKEIIAVKVTGKELGFTDLPYSAEEALEKAREIGLEPCPLWAAPQHLLNLKNDAVTTIGIEPVPGQYGTKRVLDANRIDYRDNPNGNGALVGIIASENYWIPDDGSNDMWLFALPKTSPQP